MEITIKWTVDSKSDEEAKKKVKVLFNAAYGDLAASKYMQPDMDKIRDKFWTENYIGKLKEKIDRLKMDIQNRDDEIQDLKLENDRLKQRDDLMFDFICSISCVRKQCSNCKLNRPEKFDELGAKCAYLQGPDGTEYIRNEAYNIIKRLEDL